MDHIDPHGGTKAIQTAERMHEEGKVKPYHRHPRRRSRLTPKINGAQCGATKVAVNVLAAYGHAPLGASARHTADAAGGRPNVACNTHVREPNDHREGATTHADASPADSILAWHSSRRNVNPKASNERTSRGAGRGPRSTQKAGPRGARCATSQGGLEVCNGRGRHARSHSTTLRVADVAVRRPQPQRMRRPEDECGGRPEEPCVGSYRDIRPVGARPTRRHERKEPGAHIVHGRLAERGNHRQPARNTACVGDAICMRKPGTLKANIPHAWTPCCK